MSGGHFNVSEWTKILKRGKKKLGGVNIQSSMDRSEDIHKSVTELDGMLEDWAGAVNHDKMLYHTPDNQVLLEFTPEYHKMIDDNRKILDEAGLFKNGVITDIVRDFWLMAKARGYDDITDDYVGLHIARCLNVMARKYGYRSTK